MEVKKSISFCMAHKLTNHRELHGHSYELEIVLEGNVLNDPTSPDDGLVIDYKAIEKIARDTIIDQLDRSCIISENDPITPTLRHIQDQIKIIFVPFVTSSEQVVKWIFEKLAPGFEAYSTNKIKLVALTLRDSNNTSVRYSL